MIIYCCGCKEDVIARLTSGKEIYPHRKDLYTLPFWKCKVCGNHVGCHCKTGNPTRPLGCIATKEIKQARQRIHALLDPVWEKGKYSRKQVYRKISQKLGYKYHTAEIRTIKQARTVYSVVKSLSAGYAGKK